MRWCSQPAVGSHLTFLPRAYRYSRRLASPTTPTSACACCDCSLGDPLERPVAGTGQLQFQPGVSSPSFREECQSHRSVRRHVGRAIASHVDRNRGHRACPPSVITMYAAMNLMATPPLDSLDLMTGQAALRMRAHDYMQARVVPAQHVLISSAVSAISFCNDWTDKYHRSEEVIVPNKQADGVPPGAQTGAAVPNLCRAFLSCVPHPALLLPRSVVHDISIQAVSRILYSRRSDERRLVPGTPRKSAAASEAQTEPPGRPSRCST